MKNEQVPNPERRLFLQKTADVALGVGALAVASALPDDVEAQQALTERGRVFGSDGLIIRHSKNRRRVVSEDGTPAVPIPGVHELFRTTFENKHVYFRYDTRREGWLVCSKDGKTIYDLRAEASARTGFEIVDLSFDSSMIQARLPLSVQLPIDVELMPIHTVRVTHAGDWEFVLRTYQGREHLTFPQLLGRIETQTKNLHTVYNTVSPVYERIARAQLPQNIMNFAHDANTAGLVHREGAGTEQLKETHRALFTALRKLAFLTLGPAIDAYYSNKPDSRIGSSRDQSDMFLVEHGLIPNVAIRVAEGRIDKLFFAISREETVTIGDNPALTDLFEGLPIQDMHVHTLFFNEPQSPLGGTRLNNIGIVINEGIGVPIEVIRNNELTHEILDRLVPKGLGASIGGNLFEDFDIPIADAGHVNEFLSDVASLAASPSYARAEIKRIIQIAAAPSRERPAGYELTITLCEKVVRERMAERGIGGDIVSAVDKLPEEDVAHIVAYYRDIGKRLVAHMKAKGMFTQQ